MTANPIDRDLENLGRARMAVFNTLKVTEGPERRESIRKALRAGIGATDLAKGLGISRARLYQLTEKKETR